MYGNKIETGIFVKSKRKHLFCGWMSTDQFFQSSLLERRNESPSITSLNLN